MICLATLFAFALATLSTAAPTAENIALASKYAPEFRFTSDEVYFPSSVEFFLSGIKASDGDGKALPDQPTLTAANLASAFPNSGEGVFLSVPDIDEGKGGFLRGQKPGNGQNPVVYTFVVPKSNGVVDLFYWLYSPFNEGKRIRLVGQVGDHVGDWERMTVRTVDGIAVSAEYNAHSAGQGAGVVPWSDVVKMAGEDRPVGYVARGSHGIWPTAGRFVYVDALVAKLADVTADGGPSWDSKDDILPISYPDTYTGDLDWLNFKGRWGNKGDDSCWWHLVVPDCSIVDAPNGPVRDDVLSAKSKTTSSPPKRFTSMRAPLSQTLAPLAVNRATSLYKFRLDADAISFASSNGLSIVAVEQQCTSSGANATAIALGSIAYTAILEQSQVYEVSVDACREGSHVDAYRIGICPSRVAEECTWFAARQLRTYIPNTSGVTNGTAVSLEDLDNWGWYA